MFCPHCAEPNPGEAKFCGKCGRPMPQEAPASPSMPGASASALASNPPRESGSQPGWQLGSQPGWQPGSQAVTSGMKWGIAAGSLVIPLIGMVMGVIYMRDPNLEKRAVGKMWLIVGCAALAFWILYSLTQSSNNY